MLSVQQVSAQSLTILWKYAADSLVTRAPQLQVQLQQILEQQSLQHMVCQNLHLLQQPGNQ